MSPRIATGLAAVAALVAAGTAPAWADVPDPSASASPSAGAPPAASPTADRTPVDPSASPSASPSPSPDTSSPEATPGGDDGTASEEPGDGPSATPPEADGSRDQESGPGTEDDQDGDTDGDGDRVEPFEMEEIDPEDLGDHVAEVSYTCTPHGAGGDDADPAAEMEKTFLWSAWAVPESPTAGQRIQVGAVYAGDYFWLVDDAGDANDGGVIEADSVTETGTMVLGGDAAPQEKVDFTVRAAPGEGPFDLEWDFAGSSAELTPDGGGELTFTPSDVTLTVEAEGEKRVTECTPAQAPDPLLTLQVAEEDADGGADGGDGGGGDARPAPGSGSGAASSPLGGLPVTGPALLGLAGAGAVSFGAGSAAMYLARKRPGADD